MRKILITGGAGFIGSHLCEKLVKDNYVIVLDNFDPYYSPKIKYDNILGLENNKNLSLVKGDIRSTSLANNVFKKYHPETVVHLAAKVGVRESIIQPNQYASVNITGTINILENARKYKVNNFIFTSSSSVYGNNEKLPFNENDRVDDQKSIYAFTKKIGELICEKYTKTYKMSITCLRLFTVFGPRQRPSMAISTFIRNISYSKKIVIYGDGTSLRDYIYVDDVVKAFVKIIIKNHKFDIFNIGTSSPKSLNYLINSLEKIIGVEAIRDYRRMDISDMYITHADVTKANKSLKWTAKTDFLTGLRKTINYYSEKKI